MIEPRRTLFRWLLRLLLGLTGLLAFLVVFVLVGTFVPYPLASPAADDPAARTVALYVVSNGAHTDIIVPARNHLIKWEDTLPLDEIVAKDRVAGVAWLAFGWGEREFYLTTPEWSDLTFTKATRSLFFSSASLMHIEGLAVVRETDQTRKVFLSNERYLRLAAYILDSIKLNGTGKAIRVANGYTDEDAFFEANGHYSISFTCNNWTAGGLRAAGLGTPLWAGLAQGIMWHLD